MQRFADEKIQKAIQHFSRQYYKLTPTCKNLKVIKLPTLLSCENGSHEKYKDCKTLIPNAVNSIVLNKNIIIPDPFISSFKEEIKTKLQKSGLNAYFVDTGLYNLHAGNAHCGTNVIRKWPNI